MSLSATVRKCLRDFENNLQIGQLLREKFEEMFNFVSERDEVQICDNPDLLTRTGSLICSPQIQ